MGLSQVRAGLLIQTPKKMRLSNTVMLCNLYWNLDSAIARLLTVFPSVFEPGSKRSVAAHMGWWQHSLCLINNFFLNYCVCKILKSDWFYESQLATKSMTKINYVTDYRDCLPSPVFSFCFVLKPSFTTRIQLLSLFLRMYAVEDTSYLLLRKVQLHTLGYTTYFKEFWIITPSKNLSCCLSLMPGFLNLNTTGHVRLDNSLLWWRVEEILSFMKV